MAFFSNLFKSKKSREPVVQSSEVKELLELKAFMDGKLRCDHYVAKSEFRPKLAESRQLIDYFDVLRSSGTLEQYCVANGVASPVVEGILGRAESFEELIDAQNERWIQRQMTEEESYLDNILRECDPNIKLDTDQRKVVLTDEDFCLVVAGAGAGKTTTVAAKVKYLVEKQHVKPSTILVISFTNKAVNELKERINVDLHIDCPIATFHSTGNAVLHKKSDESLNIVEGSKLYYVIQDYFKGTLLQKESTVNNLILFFASYFDAPFEGDDINKFFNQLAKSTFTTIRSELDDFRCKVIDKRTKKSVTIQSELLRSAQEAEIANFLYLNGIEYEYEPLYRYNIPGARKPYTPDFIIRQGDKTAYIEHFGVTEDGKNNRYSDDQLAAYRKAINDKVRLHRQHETTLIYTFSSFNDGRPLIDHLKEKLEDQGFELHPRSQKEVLEKLVSTEENRYIRKLVALICRFINNFKTNGYTLEDFDRMYHSTQSARSRLFLTICQDCYLEYQRYLKQNNAIDFQDMINESARILREAEEMKTKLDFSYVIVDEYQDISRQRFDLVTALRHVTDAKIIAVGDDWQSIYAFSGSDISLFTKFAEKMGYAKMMKIVRTYRNSQEVIDIAGNFIQKNESQIRKDLISPKNIENPVIIYTYDSTWKKPGEDNRTGANYAMAHAVETALERIIAYNEEEGKTRTSSVLLLGRFGFDGDLLEKSGLFSFTTRGGKLRSVKHPYLDITFMTAHASKGLGYDNVIVVNGKNETYGFPSKIQDDPVLAFVIQGDRSIDYAEERRLFYVAMTRTKNRVFFVAPEQNPSEFLLEIKHDYPSVLLQGQWNEDAPKTQNSRKVCPICGYPMQFRYKPAYGLRLHICTNEPEVCGFVTNDHKGGKLSILKCDRCVDGYLTVRSRAGDYFLGCTNYKPDRTGCNHVMTREYYYKMMGYTEDPQPAEQEDTAPKMDAAVISEAAEEKKPASVPEPHEVKVTSYRKTNYTPDASKYRVEKVAETRTTAYGTAPQKQTEQPEPAIAESTETEERGPEEPRTVETIERADVKTVLYDSIDLNEVMWRILQCLEHVSIRHYYGVNTLVDVLRGANSQKIQKGGLFLVREYGILRRLNREEVQAAVDWLIDNKYILQTKGLYPCLHPTYEGRHYGETITPGKLKKLGQAMAGVPEENEEDEQLK